MWIQIFRGLVWPCAVRPSSKKWPAETKRTFSCRSVNHGGIPSEQQDSSNSRGRTRLSKKYACNAPGRLLAPDIATCLAVHFDSAKGSFNDTIEVIQPFLLHPVLGSDNFKDDRSFFIYDESLRYSCQSVGIIGLTIRIEKHWKGETIFGNKRTYNFFSFLIDANR